MNYFDEVSRGSQSPPRVHPLLLSLSETWKVAQSTNTSPDLNSISGDDPRIFGSQYYTLASDLPPLDVQLHGNVRHQGISNHSGAVQQNFGTLAIRSCNEMNSKFSTHRSGQQCCN